MKEWKISTGSIRRGRRIHFTFHVSRFTDNTHFALILFIVCTSIAVARAYAIEGEDIGKPIAQIGGGYAAHIVGNTVGNRLLDLSDDFPTSSLSSLSVVATSFAVSVGTSAAVYGIGQAFDDDDSRSFGWTLLGGISAVGSSTLIGALIGLDDWKSGAAIGSVLGRYFVPIYATAFYYLGNGDNKSKSDAPAAPAITLITFRF